MKVIPLLPNFIIFRNDPYPSPFFSVLEEAFALFDIDGNGFISLDELTAVMQSLGKDCTEEDIKEMLELADKDGKQIVR